MRRLKPCFTRCRLSRVGNMVSHMKHERAGDPPAFAEYEWVECGSMDMPTQRQILKIVCGSLYLLHVSKSQQQQQQQHTRHSCGLMVSALPGCMLPGLEPALAATTVQEITES